MCGRYSLQTKRIDLAHELGIPESDLLDLPPRWNIAPSQPVPILRARSGRGAAGAEAARVAWGLIPEWANDPRIANKLINARMESLAAKPAFADSFRARRCLVPADGFYEWAALGGDGPRYPHYIRLASGRPFTFAGLWARWRDPSGTPVETCTIITCPPNEAIARLHDRMPVILPPDARAAWLDPALRDERALLGLLGPLPAELFEIHPVGRQVNSPDRDDPSCIEPLDPGTVEAEPPPAPRRRRKGPGDANLDLFGPG